MKAATQKKWLRELAKWLRAAAKAPAALMLLSVVGDAALGLAKVKPVFNAAAAVESVPMLALAGVLYVLFNALATWLELRAKRIKDRPRRVIILPNGRGWDDSS